MKKPLYAILAIIAFTKVVSFALENPADSSPAAVELNPPTGDGSNRRERYKSRREMYKEFTIDLLVSHIYQEVDTVIMDQEALDELRSREEAGEELVRRIDAVARGEDKWSSAWLYIRVLTDLPPLDEEQTRRVLDAVLLMDTEVRDAEISRDLAAKRNTVAGSVFFLTKNPAPETEPVLLREIARPQLLGFVTTAYDLLADHPSAERLEALRKRRERVLAAPNEVGASLEDLEKSPYFLKLTATIQKMENTRSLPRSAVEARETGENAGHPGPAARQAAVSPAVQQNQDKTSRNIWLLTAGLILFLIPALLLLLKRRRAL